MKRTTLDEAIRRAARADTGCPPPEAYLEAERGALEDAARERLDRHADGCPVCAAERRLAEAFDSDAGVDPRERERIERRLAAARSAGATAPPVVVRGPWSRRLLPLAAALLVAFGAAALWWRAAPPPLAPPEAGPTRGAELVALHPRGELAEVPDHVAWEGGGAAAAFRLSLLAVDGRVVWRAEVETSPAPLPAEARDRLRPAVVYTLEVEALDADGGLVARSAPVRFRVSPTPRSPERSSP